jgi:hypothetical protein
MCVREVLQCDIKRKGSSVLHEFFYGFINENNWTFLMFYLVDLLFIPGVIVLFYLWARVNQGGYKLNLSQYFFKISETPENS